MHSICAVWPRPMRSYRPGPLVTDIEVRSIFGYLFFFSSGSSFVCAMFKLCTVEGFSFVSMSLIFCFQVTTFSMPLVVQLKRMANNLVSSFLEIRCNGCNGPQMVVSPAGGPPEWSAVSSTTPRATITILLIILLITQTTLWELGPINSRLHVQHVQNSSLINFQEKTTLIWSANHHQQKPPPAADLSRQDVKIWMLTTGKWLSETLRFSNLVHKKIAANGKGISQMRDEPYPVQP